MADISRLIRRHIDRAAAKADGAPSRAQKEAGNYRKGKIRIHGLDIAIENPRGSVRTGVGKDGKPWRVTLPDHYGYINRTEGSDGDHVDCYIGRHPMSSRVFVIDQVDAETGEHDEHKCMLGYNDRESAISAYLRAFSDGRGRDRLDSMKEMNIAQFKRWLHREGGLPKYAAGGRVGYAEGGAPDGFNPAEFSAFKADIAKPPAEAGGFDPAAFAAFKSAPPAAPKEAAEPFVAPAGLDDSNLGGPSTALGDKAAQTAAGALLHAPHSAVEFAKNTVQPFLHPIDTATNLKNLGLGVLEKTGVVPGGEHEKYADAVGQFFADRYGGIENARKTLETDPVGMAGDLSMLLTGGGGIAARAPGVVGRAGEVVANAGRVMDPLRAAAPVAQAIGTGLGHAASEFAGVTTGAGGQPLRTATRAGIEGGPAGQAFRENLTGAAPLEDAVNEARGALQNIRQQRGDAYRAEMAKVGADATPLDFTRIDNAVASAQGVKTYSGRSGTGPAQSLSPKTEGIRKEMTDTIDEWKNLDPAEFHSAEGIDALKQKLGDIRDGTEPHTPARVAADRIYNAVRQTIIDQVPEYAKVMKGYEEASKQIKEIETTLSLKPNANIDTSLRKLQSTLRDNVNTSFGRRTELANYLVNAGAPHLMERLAGQALHAWVPRGLARVATMEAVPFIAGLFGAGVTGAGAAAAAMLPTMSPRLMGNLAYGIGAAQRRLAPVLGPAARASRQIGQIANAPPFGNMPNPFAPR